MFWNHCTYTAGLKKEHDRRSINLNINLSWVEIACLIQSMFL